MIYFKLALRNTFRNKRRTALTLFSIAIGIAAIILYKSFISYSMWGLQESTIRNGLGHIQIAKSNEYFETGEYDPFNFLINDYKGVANSIKKIEHVKSVVPKISFPATLASSSKSGITMIHATPTTQSFELLSFRNIINGREIVSSGAYEIILGAGLAKKLDLKINDTVTLMGVMRGGGINAMDVKVVGISSSGIKEIDNIYSYLDLETAKSFLGIKKVPQLIILLDNTENLKLVMQDINKRDWKNSIISKSWIELSSYYKQVKTFYQNLLDVIQFIILTIVIFAIINTITMSVLERVRETGTLRTIGAKRKTIILMFLQEAGIIGFFGGLFGVVVALIISIIINQMGGVYIPPPPGMSEGYYALFPPSIKVMLEGVLWAFVISIIGAVYPAIKSVNYSVADSLRHI
jgi:putative ABC transport system permease protein